MEGVDDLQHVVETLNLPIEDGGCPYTNSLSAQLLLVSISKDFARIDSTLSAVAPPNEVRSGADQQLNDSLGDLLFDSLMLLHVCAREHGVEPGAVWRDAIHRIKERTPYIAEWGDESIVKAVAEQHAAMSAAAATRSAATRAEGPASPPSPLSPASPRSPTSTASPTAASSTSVSPTTAALAASARAHLTVKTSPRSTQPQLAMRDDVPMLPLSPMAMQAEALHWDSRCTILAAGATTSVNVQVPGAWGLSPTVDPATGKTQKQIYALSWTFSCLNDIRFRLVLVCEKKGKKDIEVISPCTFVGGRYVAVRAPPPSRAVDAPLPPPPPPRSRTLLLRRFPRAAGKQQARR